MISEPLHCPVCSARFRGTRACSRCGADLGPLMTLAAAAHSLRHRAVEALEDGLPATAHRHAAAARQLHATPRGCRLELLTRWLATLDASPRR